MACYYEGSSMLIKTIKGPKGDDAIIPPCSEQYQLGAYSVALLTSKEIDIINLGTAGREHLVSMNTNSVIIW
eukprot:CAMPEP_0113938294 /NCGR_PEP_ID=MMETSP1339-20121228/4707_1 /TAXON_ID=94617 /ORGANISM="Fibrocapsa japonica" /LENGTH=71 /DNA_ID=CAMNT_0000941337 /DNA_START=169 /DNA_END=381 /DNA_ORIENTATION=- /assembly_acc=CAM_ASM_000762